jgi:hypothetical protein
MVPRLFSIIVDNLNKCIIRKYLDGNLNKLVFIRLFHLSIMYNRAALTIWAAPLRAVFSFHPC